MYSLLFVKNFRFGRENYVFINCKTKSKSFTGFRHLSPQNKIALILAMKGCLSSQAKGKYTFKVIYSKEKLLKC